LELARRDAYAEILEQNRLRQEVLGGSHLDAMRVVLPHRQAPPIPPLSAGNVQIGAPAGNVQIGAGLINFNYQGQQAQPSPAVSAQPSPAVSAQPSPARSAKPRRAQ